MKNQVDYKALGEFFYYDDLDLEFDRVTNNIDDIDNISYKIRLINSSNSINNEIIAVKFCSSLDIILKGISKAFMRSN